MAQMWVMFPNYSAVLETGCRHSAVAKNPDHASLPSSFHFKQATCTQNSIALQKRRLSKTYQNMSNCNEKWPSHCLPLTTVWSNL